MEALLPTLPIEILIKISNDNLDTGGVMRDLHPALDMEYERKREEYFEKVDVEALIIAKNYDELYFLYEHGCFGSEQYHAYLDLCDSGEMEHEDFEMEDYMCGIRYNMSDSEDDSDSDSEYDSEYDDSEYDSDNSDSEDGDSDSEDGDSDGDNSDD